MEYYIILHFSHPIIMTRKLSFMIINKPRSCKAFVVANGCKCWLSITLPWIPHCYKKISA